MTEQTPLERAARECPDLRGNPVDVIEWLAEQAGRELDPEWLAYWRDYCEQPADAALGE